MNAFAEGVKVINAIVDPENGVENSKTQVHKHGYGEP